MKKTTGKKVYGVAAIDHLHPQRRVHPAHRRRIGLGRVGQVGLGEHHHRRHPHFARHHQIAFQPRDAEILVARCDDEQRVDIRRDQLRLARIAG